MIATTQHPLPNSIHSKLLNPILKILPIELHMLRIDNLIQVLLLHLFLQLYQLDHPIHIGHLFWGQLS